VKLLLDENLSPRLATDVAAIFPGSTHVDLAGLHGKSDDAIWEHARVDGFTIVSKDNDFRQRSFLKGSPPKVIWLSVGNADTDAISQLLRTSRNRIANFISAPEESLLVLELREEKLVS
jgi:predicted nuclease of predicted toxin-antitoxin system